LQVGQDIQTTSATTIWDSNNSEIPDGALGTVDAGTLNLSNEFTNSSGVLNVDESNVDHDSLQNFVSNEHIDHSTVNINSGTGLSGGSDITSDVTLNLDANTSDLNDAASPNATAAGQLLIYDATDSQFENATLTGGNAINVANADASVTLSVPTDGIGTDELDQSAGYSFSNLGATTITGDLDMSNNNINDVASIDGGGDAVTFNDDIDMNTGGSITGLGDLTHNAAATFEIKQETNNSFRIDNTGGGLITLRTNNGSGTITARAFIDGGSTTQPFNLQNNTPLNMADSDSIQDAGTDAIQFDGSANVTMPNGDLSLEGGQLKKNSNNFFIQQTGSNQTLSLENKGGGIIEAKTVNGSGGFKQRIEITGGVATADVNILNSNLDLNDNLIIDPSNNATADSMTANPETDSEDGYIEVEIDGTTRQIPFYNQ